MLAAHRGIRRADERGGGGGEGVENRLLKSYGFRDNLAVCFAFFLLMQKAFILFFFAGDGCGELQHLESWSLFSLLRVSE